MPAMTSAASAASGTPTRKPSTAPEKKYKCQFCNRAFSRSEHRSRHERSRKFRTSSSTLVFLSSGVGPALVGSLFGLAYTHHDFPSSPPLLVNRNFPSANSDTPPPRVPTQIPKSDRSNAASAEVPLCGEICSSATIAPCTPKMEAFRCTAKSSGAPAPRRRPRRPPPNNPSSWTRPPWNR